jgi:predicted DsbA family dithiol-disulfide isomerase
MEIAVFSDVICPWCFVGKRRLERALDELGWRDRVAIEWLPFELNPDMPAGGMERAAYRARKFGPERSAMLDQQMRAVGDEEGIRFAFDRMTRTPNTRRAHMLVAGAARQGDAPAVVERLVEALFQAYFEEGRDIGDEATLTEIASLAGLDREQARAALRDETLERLVVQTEGRAGELGISGVPYFIVDRSWAVSGAQPSHLWVEALRKMTASAERAAG